MVKNRTNSTKYFDEILNEFQNSIPTTPKIPNLNILQIPPKLKLPEIQKNTKQEQNKKKEEEEIFFVRKNKNQKTFENYLNRLQNDFINLQAENIKFKNRRRIFSENTDIDINLSTKNSIFTFLKNRPKNRN